MWRLQLQQERYTKAEFDHICKELQERDPDPTGIGWGVNPHRSWTGLGNYDVNVVMEALQRIGYCVQWFDQRLDMENIFDQPHLQGCILNVLRSRFGGLYRSRHWLSLVRMGPAQQIFNLDSELESPQCFTSNNELKQFLQNAIQHQGGHLFLVLKNHPNH